MVPQTRPTVHSICWWSAGGVTEIWNMFLTIRSTCLLLDAVKLWILLSYGFCTPLEIISWPVCKIVAPQRFLTLNFCLPPPPPPLTKEALSQNGSTATTEIRHTVSYCHCWVPRPCQCSSWLPWVSSVCDALLGQSTPLPVGWGSGWKDEGEEERRKARQGKEYAVIDKVSSFPLFPCLAGLLRSNCPWITFTVNE